MKKFWALLLALCLLGGFALGECPRFALEDYPRVDGSTSMLPLSRALMMASTGVGAQEAELRVSHAKTTLSFYALVGGEADLLLVARPAQEAFDYAEDMGVELEMRPIGVDALVFLTSDQNPVDSLTQAQAAGIYTGEITNWKDVGGNDAEIVVIGREAGSGTRDGFESITGTEEACAYRQELTSTGDVIATVAGNPDAIGYTSLSAVEDNVKALSVGGVAPSEATVKDGSYVIQRPFVLVTKTDAKLSEAAQMFFDYITSAEAAEVIAAAGVVAVN